MVGEEKDDESLPDFLAIPRYTPSSSTVEEREDARENAPLLRA